MRIGKYEENKSLAVNESRYMICSKDQCVAVGK
jgi:hypothetical protein